MIDADGSDNVSAQPNQQSKSALKKLRKQERFAANKLERRAKEKEVRKEKKRIKAQKRAAGELDGDHDEDARRSRKRPRIADDFKGRVVVDLGFDDKMSEKEIKSLCSQLAYTYSANRQASYPFALVFTSLNGKTFERLESINDASYKRWSNTEWWDAGYEKLWSDALPPPSDDAADDAQRLRGAKGSDELRTRVVYLTADAEEELNELRADETYIIGGICDHNRYKNLCLNKASESGIRAARLPIGRYLAHLPTRKVLTVNQVFEILLRWVETRDWEEALYAVMPKRKFQGAGTQGHGSVDQAQNVIGDCGASDGIMGASTEEHIGTAGLSSVEAVDRELVTEANDLEGLQLQAES